MNFKIHNVSTGESTIVPEMGICAWKNHDPRVCLPGMHKGQYVLPGNLRVVHLEIFEKLGEVVVYVQPQDTPAQEVINRLVHKENV